MMTIKIKVKIPMADTFHIDPLTIAEFIKEHFPSFFFDMMGNEKEIWQGESENEFDSNRYNGLDIVDGEFEEIRNG